MTTRRRRGGYTPRLTRRQQIVNAGLADFSSPGFHQGSLRDVAERAGLSQAGLLHHYPSKEQLLKAVFTWRDNEARTRLRELVQLLLHPEAVDIEGDLRRSCSRSWRPTSRRLSRRRLSRRRLSRGGTSENQPSGRFVLGLFPG
jgi:AcrR family transcriptional regulator